MSRPVNWMLAVVAAAALMASPAQAYIGPGAGLTAIGAFIALIAAVVVAIVAFIWFPIRRMMRKAKGPATVLADSDDDDV